MIQPSVRSAIRLALSTILAVAPLAACSETPATPDGAVLESARALRSNDLRRFLASVLDDAQYESMRWEWKQKAAPTPAQSKQFAEALAKLTDDGAEERLFASLRPKLDELRPQVTIMLGMLEGMGEAQLETRQDMTEEQREQGRRALATFVQVLRENDLASADKARSAIEIVCRTARGLSVASLADLHAMELEDALDEAGVVLGGLKDLLALYGLSVDRVLDSVEATTLEETGDRAKVVIAYELLGERHLVETWMTRTATGRWVRAAEGATAELQSALGR